MTSNVVKIDIEVTDNGTQAAEKARRIAKPMTDAAGQIDRAFDRTSKQMATSLDKIEREAWQSGKGMSDAFGTAMGGLRRGLELAREEARETGAGLHSSVGKSLLEIKKNADQLAESLKPVAQATVPINANWEKTSRLISTELDRIERDAWDAGRGIDRAFQQALSEVREDFARIRQAGKDAGAGLDSELGESLLAIKQRMADLRTDVKANPISLDDLFSGGTSASGISDLIMGGGKWAAIGGAVGAALWSGLQTEWQEDKIGALMAAQTGAAAGQAERLGDMTGDVFVSSFAGSLDQVSDAMAAAFNNKLINVDDVDSQIERVTKKVMTLATTTGDSTQKITWAARNMLLNGVAGNVTEALDMIQNASDKGLNYADDFLDTAAEYSAHFKVLGLDGADAFGLIGQAADAGARNTDQAADALKEFGIRAQDMSVLTRRSFETIGLDADVMGRKVAAGGSEAKDALRQTLNALQTMPSEIDRNSAAVGLFGAKAEDLGQALYHMDLDNASESFGDFAGAVEKARQKLEAGTTGAEKFDKLMTGIKGSIGEAVDTLADFDSGTLDEMANKVNDLKLAQEAWLSSGDTTPLDSMKAKYPELADAIDAYIDKTREEAEANANTTNSIDNQITTLDDLISKYSEAAGGIIGLSEAQIRNQKALADANEALAKNGENLNTATEGGRENQQALNDLVTSTYSVIKAMQEQRMSSDEVAAFMQIQRDEYIRLADAMGLSSDEAIAMANSLGLIPGNYNANVTLSGADYAIQRAADFKALIESVPNSKVVNLRVSTSGNGHYLAGLESGGIVGAPRWSAASGGQRHGSTLINEAGPEVADLPNGTRMLTAGATRALAEAGAFGGGGGILGIEWTGRGPTDRLARAFWDWMREEIAFRYGGNVQSGLGQSGA